MDDRTFSESFEVEQIVDEKMINGQLHYLVKWLGYGHQENTWQPMRHMTHTPHKLQEWEQYKKKQLQMLQKRQTLNKVKVGQSSVKMNNASKDPKESIKKQQSDWNYFEKQINRPEKLFDFTKDNGKGKRPKKVQIQQKKSLKQQKLQMFEERIKARPKVWQQYVKEHDVEEANKKIQQAIDEAFRVSDQIIRSNCEALSRNQLNQVSESSKPEQGQSSEKEKRIRFMLESSQESDESTCANTEQLVKLKRNSENQEKVQKLEGKKQSGSIQQQIPSHNCQQSPKKEPSNIEQKSRPQSSEEVSPSQLQKEPRSQLCSESSPVIRIPKPGKALVDPKSIVIQTDRVSKETFERYEREKKKAQQQLRSKLKKEINLSTIQELSECELSSVQHKSASSENAELGNLLDGLGDCKRHHSYDHMLQEGNHEKQGGEDQLSDMETMPEERRDEPINKELLLNELLQSYSI